MNAKVFSHGSNELEGQLNEWLLTAGKIKICYQITTLVYDLYSCIAPQVCNQWYETTVYFEEYQTPTTGDNARSLVGSVERTVNPDFNDEAM